MGNRQGRRGKKYSMHNGHREQWVSQGVVSTEHALRVWWGRGGEHESAVPATAAYPTSCYVGDGLFGFHVSATPCKGQRAIRLPPIIYKSYQVLVLVPTPYAFYKFWLTLNLFLDNKFRALLSFIFLKNTWQVHFVSSLDKKNMSRNSFLDEIR